MPYDSRQGYVVCCLFPVFVCPVKDFSRLEQPISMKVCTVVSHSFPCFFVHFGGDTPSGIQMADPQTGRGLKFWPLANPFDRDYLQNGKCCSLCQSGLKISMKKLPEK